MPTVKETILKTEQLQHSGFYIYPENAVKNCIQRTQFEGMPVKGITGEQIGEVKNAEFEDGEVIAEMKLDKDFGSSYHLEGGFKEFSHVVEIDFGSI